MAERFGSTIAATVAFPKRLIAKACCLAICPAPIIATRSLSGCELICGLRS